VGGYARHVACNEQMEGFRVWKIENGSIEELDFGTSLLLDMNNIYIYAFNSCRIFLLPMQSQTISRIC
jgi:hypothetical protein